MNKNNAKKVLNKAISTMFENAATSALKSQNEVKYKNFTFQAPNSIDQKEEVVVEIDWNLTAIKKQIAIYANEGKLSADLIKTICKNGTCAPVEFELLDYKEDLEPSNLGLAKFILRIVSFYNSYGGYIVFGVAETESETKFDVIGFDSSKLNLESIKALIKEFTGIRIQVNSINLEVLKEDGQLTSVLFLHIPRRPNNEPPLHFLKNGPGDSKGKALFQKEEVYCRRGDECVQAKGPKILELNSDRANPYVSQEGNAVSGLFRLNRLPHNLPDRNFICPKFVGRDNILDSLWIWLADDLSHIRVLAGEGGLGKSSIAYEFAERVSETPGVPFDHLVWLTAKEKQFKAYEDKYENVPERHYRSYLELLNAICVHLPYTSDELEGATETELKRMVKKGLVETPSLIIIDDVDSLTVEEQKQVLELGLITGGTKSRVLLTTRNNQSYSNDTVLKISGFSLGEEFNEYMHAIQERLDFKTLNASDIEKIHSTTNGSPLFTESLIRLLRWNTLNDAISMWKNERGATVRAAALKREIELLTSEAKRILLAIAIIAEASVIELSEILGYPSESIENGLHELTSLFLIAAPSLASIPRFRVPDNTRRLVIDVNTTLVTDRARLERDITNFKQKNNQKPTKDTRVAAAISQSGALLRTGDINNAIATIRDSRKRTQDHFDLLSFEATLLLKTTPPQIDESRKLARKAYLNGCKKPEVFECWFEAEWLAKNFVGALEAAEAALKERSSGNHDWLIKKSAALANKASDQSKSGSVGIAISTMFEASKTIKSAMVVGNRDDAIEWKNQQYQFHDQIWVWPISEEGLGKTAIQLDILENMKKSGDFRQTNKKRVLSAVTSLACYIERKQDRLSTTQKNLYSTLISKANALLKDEQYDRGEQNLPQLWDSLQTRVAIAIDKYE